MLFDFIVWFYAEFYLYGMVLNFIWSYCTVSHCYVPLMQRAGELPRSASSHFFDFLGNILVNQILDCPKAKEVSCVWIQPDRR